MYLDSFPKLIYVISRKKPDTKQVLRTVLDDENDKNDQDSQDLIVNDKDNPLLEQQPNFHLPSPRKRSSKLANRSFSFWNLSNSVDYGFPSTSSVTQSTPVAKEPSIPHFKHLKKAFTTSKVLELVMNSSDIKLDNQSDEYDARQFYSDDTYQPSNGEGKNYAEFSSLHEENVVVLNSTVGSKES